MHLHSKLIAFKRNSLKMWLQKVTKVSLSWFDWIFPAEISSNIEQYISGEQQHNHLPSPGWCDLLCHVSSSSGLSGGKITMLGNYFPVEWWCYSSQNQTKHADITRLWSIRKIFGETWTQTLKKRNIFKRWLWKILVFWISWIDCFNVFNKYIKIRLCISSLLL